MTSPPPSETGATAEERADCEELAHGWLVMSETAPFEARVESLTRLMLGIRSEAKRSAHLEDARAGCIQCAQVGPPDYDPKHGSCVWWHGSRACNRPEVWDALSMPPGGRP